MARSRSDAEDVPIHPGATALTVMPAAAMSIAALSWGGHGRSLSFVMGRAGFVMGRAGDQ
jgi:hypothetical protein